MDEHGLNLNLHLHPMGTDHQDHTGAYGQGEMDRHDLNLNLHLHPMGTYHQDNTGAHDSRLLTTWNQQKMGALNPNPMGTHSQGQTGTYDPSYVGTYGQGQMYSHHQSEIDSHEPSYMSPQYATDIDVLTRNFLSSKPIKTRGNQPPRPGRVHDGSRTARLDRSAYLNFDDYEQRLPLDTSRLDRKKSSKIPRTRSEHPEK